MDPLRQRRHQQELKEEEGEEDRGAGGKTGDQVGERVPGFENEAVDPPFGQVEREEDGGDGRHGQGEEADEQDKGRQLSREQRP
jgi:hypothetical protein